MYRPAGRGVGSRAEVYRLPRQELCAAGEPVTVGRPCRRAVYFPRAAAFAVGTLRGMMLVPVSYRLKQPGRRACGSATPAHAGGRALELRS